MKRFAYFTFIIIALLTFVSCSDLNPSEKLLVGQWYSSASQDGANSFVWEEYDTYKEDRTSEFHGTVRYTITDKENGIQEIVTCEIKGNGTWSIKDKRLEENITYADVSIKDVEFTGDNVTNDKSQLREAIDSEKKRLYYDLAVPFKKELMGESVDKIKTLNDNKLVTVDKDGEVSEYSRISTK